MVSPKRPILPNEIPRPADAEQIERLPDLDFEIAKQKNVAEAQEAMKIYLLRHGIAEIGSAGDPDSARALTGEGRAQLREILAVAKKADVSPSVVISSPYKRALETASIAASVLDYKGKVEQSQSLVPGATVEEVWDLLRENRSEEEVLLVGHQPLFGAAAAYLLAAPNLLIDFKKGGLMRVDVMSYGPTPRAELKWYLTAKLAA